MLALKYTVCTGECGDRAPKSPEVLMFVSKKITNNAVMSMARNNYMYEYYIYYKLCHRHCSIVQHLFRDKHQHLMSLIRCPVSTQFNMTLIHNIPVVLHQAEQQWLVIRSDVDPVTFLLVWKTRWSVCKRLKIEITAKAIPLEQCLTCNFN